MQKHILGLTVMLMGLAHLVWSPQLAEFHRRTALPTSPKTVAGVRALGVFLALLGLLALCT